MTLPWNRPEQHEFDWLRSQGVSEEALDEYPHIGAAYVQFDGSHFEEAEGRRRALTFVIYDCGEFIDFAAWQPQTGELATWRGAGFAIGQDQIFNPATYFDGGDLRVHADPLAWLKADREGIVIVKPELTYAYLRNRRWRHEQHGHQARASRRTDT
jgi:hypothetical protein